VVEPLLSIQEALGSILNRKKEKKRKKPGEQLKWQSAWIAIV
jgi:hypothetical protein